MLRVRVLSADLELLDEGDIEEFPFTVGRSAECDLCLERDGISRRHLEIAALPEGIVLNDLESTNGTYLDGRRIKRHLLRGKVRVRVGPYYLELIDTTAGAFDVDQKTKAEQPRETTRDYEIEGEDLPVPREDKKLFNREPGDAARVARPATETRHEPSPTELPESKLKKRADAEAAARDEKRRADEREQRRLADEKEARRVAEEREQRRLADERETKRKAEIEAETRRRAAEREARRLAEEREAKRRADEREARRLAEEREARRLAEEREMRRQAEERAELMRLAEEAEARRRAELDHARDEERAREEERHRFDESEAGETNPAVNTDEAYLGRELEAAVAEPPAKEKLLKKKKGRWDDASQPELPIKGGAELPRPSQPPRQAAAPAVAPPADLNDTLDLDMPALGAPAPKPARPLKSPPPPPPREPTGAQPALASAVPPPRAHRHSGPVRFAEGFFDWKLGIALQLLPCGTAFLFEDPPFELATTYLSIFVLAAVLVVIGGIAARIAKQSWDAPGLFRLAFYGLSVLVPASQWIRMVQAAYPARIDWFLGLGVGQCLLWGALLALLMQWALRCGRRGFVTAAVLLLPVAGAIFYPIYESSGAQRLARAPELVPLVSSRLSRGSIGNLEGFLDSVNEDYKTMEIDRAPATSK